MGRLAHALAMRAIAARLRIPCGDETQPPERALVAYVHGQLGEVYRLHPLRHGGDPMVAVPTLDGDAARHQPLTLEGVGFDAVRAGYGSSTTARGSWSGTAARGRGVA